MRPIQLVVASVVAVVAGLTVTGLTAAVRPAAVPPAAVPRAAAATKDAPPPTYLPSARDSQIVSVTTTGQPATRIIVQTQAVAIKETGPKQTVSRFGEVYAFAPGTLIVHRDEPTLIEFWNLQPDDDHDFMLMDPRWAVLMKVMLPALQRTSYIFTFHEEGVFNFYCAMHQPAMNGQILVVAPVGTARRSP
jgi:plastocyanin